MTGLRSLPGFSAPQGDRLLIAIVSMIRWRSLLYNGYADERSLLLQRSEEYAADVLVEPEQLSAIRLIDHHVEWRCGWTNFHIEGIGLRICREQAVAPWVTGVRERGS